MLELPIPQNEEERLEELFHYQILDTPPEPILDDIVKLATFICETPLSSITLIDKDRQWFKSSIGFGYNETPRDEAICAHTIMKDEMLIVEDASQDIRFKDSSGVRMFPHIRFYAGIPLITPKGFHIGTLCVLDNKSRKLNDYQLFALKTLSKTVLNHFELRLKIRNLERLDELKNRLMSILSHDLRSPLNHLKSIVELIDLKSISQEDFHIIKSEITKSIKINGDLLENLLEWASSQLNEKPSFEKINLYQLVEKEMEEVKSAAQIKNNQLINLIDADFETALNIGLIKMILRNLLQNANKFTQSGKITCIATKIDNQFVRFEIADTGIGMSEEKLQILFDWDSKHSTLGTNKEKGAGVGLLLCKDYLERLGGTMSVQSEKGVGTTFICNIPIRDLEKISISKQD